MTRLQKAVRVIMVTCLNLKTQDSVLIVSEDSLANVGEALWRCAKRMCKKSALIRYANSTGNKHELPPVVQNSLTAADCAVILSPKVVTRTCLVNASENGARLLLLSNTSVEIIERAIDTDYKKLDQISRRLADIFSIGRSLRVTSPSGTDVTLTISNLKGTPDTGIVKTAGEISRLPAGEAFVAPSTKSIHGQIVVDRIAGNKRRLSQPVILKIQRGRITQIKGKKEAERLRRDVRKFGKNGRRVTELGVGTNRALVLGNSSQEDERVFGTAHITIGRDRVTQIQQKITQSIKALILDPTIVLDGKTIVRAGDIIA